MPKRPSSTLMANFAAKIGRSKAVARVRPLLAGTAEIGMSPVDSATGRDVPHTRLRAIVATPSGSTADQASPRRQRQHFRGRDPLRKYDEENSLPQTRHWLAASMHWTRKALSSMVHSAGRACDGLRY